nr:MAG TPA: hypothetical protein [Caudoviricetes sp.]
MTVKDKTFGLQNWVNENNITTDTFSKDLIIDFIKRNFNHYNIIDNIEEAQEVYGEDVEVSECKVEKSEYIYIANGDWQDTYRVELVGLNDGRGGDIDFYIIKIVAK